MDSPPLDQLGELELSDSKFTRFLLKYKKLFIYGFLSVIVLLFGVQRFVASRTSHSEQEYVNAEADFYQLQSHDAQSESALTKLQQAIDLHHELHAKYDGAIAQSLIKLNHIAAAKEYATPALHRTAA